MIRLRSFALVVGGTMVLAAGCTSISLPSLPPLQSLPPFEIPSGLLPSADPNSGACLLVTPAEMSSILGAQVTVTESDTNSCSYTLPSFATVIVATTGDTELTGVRFLFGDSARDITIGGFPAISGLAIGQPGVYVQRPNGQLTVQGILLGNDDATMQRLVQVATTAVARLQ
jgi:hypothetical protein